MIGFGRSVAGAILASGAILRERRIEIAHLGLSVGVRLLAVLASMATLILSARWLGPDGRGAIATISTWSAIAANVAALSLGQASVRHAADHRGEAWLAPALSALLGFAGLATLACWATLAGIYLVSGGRAIGSLPPVMLLVGFAIIPLLIWEQYGSALLTLAGRIVLFNIGQVAGRLGVLILAALLVTALDTGVVGFLLAMLLGQAATALIGSSALVRAAGGLRRPDFAVMRRLVSDGVRLHLNTIGVLLFTGIDILMLQYWKGLREVGLFQLASQLFITTLIVPQSAVLLLNGKVQVLERAAFWRYHRSLLLLVVAAMIAGGILLALIARPVIIALTSSAFASSADLLRLLLLALPAATLNAMMGIQWVTRGWLLQASIITLAAGAVNVAANLVLIPAYGAYGAALATVVGIYVIPFTSNALLLLRLNQELKRAPVA